MLVDTEIAAMGTTARFYVYGAPSDIEPALRAHLDNIEQLWSRFVPSSEVSDMNRSAGSPVVVTASTLDLVDKAITASQRTRGWFDPLLLDQVVAAGYAQPFAELEFAQAPLVAISSTAAPQRIALHEWPARAAHLRIDHNASTVTVPCGSAFDPGGIGKGLAADQLAALALAGGAGSAMINLGGDIMCAGTAPAGGWTVAIENPFDLGGAPVAHVRIEHGAVATSTVARRRWSSNTGVAHHLIDPTTQAPANSGLVAVTALGASCWFAESVAKAALVAGLEVGLDILHDNGIEALLFDTQGDQHLTANMADYIDTPKKAAR